MQGTGPETGWVNFQVDGIGVVIQGSATKPVLRSSMPANSVCALPVLPALQASKWVAKYQHAPGARCRLVCAFGAGHDAAAFGCWNTLVSARYPALELVLLVLPGHGGNRQIPLQNHAAVLARLAADELFRVGGPDLGMLALFGFSIGAVVMYALALEVASRGHVPARLYCAGRGGPAFEYRHPEGDQQETPADYVRWFAHTFASANDTARTEKLIKMSEGEPDNSFLRMISETQRMDLELGNSLVSVPVKPAPCHIHVVASKADLIWPAGPSLKVEAFCQPPYEDISATWAGCTTIGVTSSYFEDLAHNELCAERLLEEVCNDLSSVLLVHTVDAS